MNHLSPAQDERKSDDALRDYVDAIRHAERLHRLSTRWDEPLVTMNCAALPETLIEAELFGHEAGAFTGATKQRVGRFEEADKGTLFLDELGTLSMAAQERLNPIEPRRRIVEQRGALGSGIAFGHQLERIPQHAIVATDLVDREIALEHAAFRPGQFDDGLIVAAVRLA